MNEGISSPCRMYDNSIGLYVPHVHSSISPVRTAFLSDLHSRPLPSIPSPYDASPLLGLPAHPARTPAGTDDLLAHSHGCHHPHDLDERREGCEYEKRKKRKKRKGAERERAFRGVCLQLRWKEL